MSIVVSELLLTGIIEVLTTSNEGEVKTHDRRENKIMLASWSKNSGTLC